MMLMHIAGPLPVSRPCMPEVLYADRDVAATCTYIAHSPAYSTSDCTALTGTRPTLSSLLMLSTFSPLLYALALVSSTLMVRTGVAKNLVPAKRASHLESRDVWQRDIVPSDSVKLNYGVC